MPRFVPVILIASVLGVSSAEADDTSYAATRCENGWQAPNPAQGFRSQFSDRGVRVVPAAVDSEAWSWGLEYLDAPVKSIRADGNRIEFDRGSIVEWYVNDTNGLKHGFTLESPPKRHGEVALDLALTGTLHPIFSTDGQAVDFESPGGAVVLRYAQLSVFDAAGEVLPSRMQGFAEDGARGIRLVFNDEDAVYPVTVDPLTTSATWTAESDQAAAWYGYSVSTAGDVNGDGYSDLIVGSPSYDNGQSDEGRAYVYLGSASGPSAAPISILEPNQAGAYFGWSVSTAGDVNGDGYDDVIVGAPYQGTVEFQEGAAYLYYGTATGLSTAPAWVVEGNQIGANLGYAVSTAGDVNGDGYADVLAGAPYYDNGAFDRGRVYVYLGSASGPSTTAAAILEGDQTSTEFGGAVATAGDVNGDGYADVIVGARYYDNVEFNEGRALVYLGSSSGLATTAVWTAEPNQVGAAFGTSVSSAGDVNGDGYADVVVGAPDYDLSAGGNQGALYVAHGSSTGLGPAIRRTNTPNSSARYGTSVATAGDIDGDGFADVVAGASSSPDPGFFVAEFGSVIGLRLSNTRFGSQVGERFGAAVATAGDVNGDGYSDIVVGAYLYDGGQYDEGRVSVFSGAPDPFPDRNSSVDYPWHATGDALSTWILAESVSTAGEVNGDGYSDVIASDNNSQAAARRAYVFLGSETGLGTVPSATLQGGPQGDGFGWSVSTAGDVNGDGFDDVVVGAPQHISGGMPRGRAYVYLGSAVGTMTNAAWAVDGELDCLNFGSSVAAAGDVNGDGYGDVLVGAPGACPGRAYLFLGSSSGLSASPAQILAGAQVGDGFGFAVASAGDVNADGYCDVLVGAPYYGDAGTDRGRAYLYLGSPSGVAMTAAWTAIGDRASGVFGTAVASAGDVNGDGHPDVAVGAPGVNAGRVFVFHGSATGLGSAPAWTKEGEQAGSAFGNAVSAAGDLEGDGFSELVVGAKFYFDLGSTVGKALVYRGSAAGLSEWPVFEQTGRTNAFFGECVAPAGDVNGDGYADFVVGAPLEAEGGAAYVYSGGVATPAGLRPRQFRTDGATPLALHGKSDSEASFAVGIRARTPAGRGKIKLQWEAKSASAQYDGMSLGASTVQETGVPGTSGSARDVVAQVSGLAEGSRYRWRMRIASADPFFPRSRWISLPGNDISETKLRTAGCIDRDGDGYGAIGDPGCSTPFVDCNDTASDVWAIPGSTANLLFTSKTNLTWSAPASPGGAASGLVYDTLRSTVASSFTASTCVESDSGPDTSAFDSTTPTQGQAYFYLSRPQNVCGAGSLGTTSVGAERVGVDCP